MTSTMTTIEISPEDFRKVNAALIRLLLALHECDGSLPTRKLYDNAAMSYSYGSRIITKIVREGYITRVRVPKREGEKGNHQMVNKLTSKGVKLLKALELFTPLIDRLC